MPKSARTGPGFPAPAEWEYQPEPIPDESPAQYAERRAQLVCPGWLLLLPTVAEAALAHRWLKYGALDSRMDGEPVTEPLKRAMDILDGAIGDVEVHAVMPEK